MVFEHGNRPDPRHEPIYGAEITRARQAESEQRIGHGERDTRQDAAALAMIEAMLADGGEG